MLRFLSLLVLCSFGLSAELLTEKQRFVIDQFTTFNGQTLRQVAFGWESYGQLNAAKDNAILIAHYFSGTSHAAGKYSADDPQTGYWDAIIGPGKAIDTNRYFVLSVDTLANLNVYDPHVITTGPASTNPTTGKPYGLSFPVMTIRDFVNAQKALIDSLGIEKLHAVIGASMGSMQALDWAAAYPERVARMVSVIGTGQSDAWTVTQLEHWATPIRLDPQWNNGNYYGSEPPLAGLTASLMMISQIALHPDFINASVSEHQPLQKQPLENIHGRFAAVDWLRNRAAARATIADANHLLYLTRASQLFMAGFADDMASGLAKVQAKSLFLPAANDQLLLPYMAEQTHQTLLRLGKSSQLQPITPAGVSLGHLDGIANISLAARNIRDFLHQPINTGSQHE